MAKVEQRDCLINRLKGLMERFEWDEPAIRRHLRTVLPFVGSTLEPIRTSQAGSLGSS
jgi:hypothetical protein